MAKASTSSGAVVTARLLINTSIKGTSYPPNTLVTGSKATITELIKSGFADASPEAVKYCLGEGISPITLDSVAEPAPEPEPMLEPEPAPAPEPEPVREAAADKAAED